MGFIVRRIIGWGECQPSLTEDRRQAVAITMLHISANASKLLNLGVPKTIFVLGFHCVSKLDGSF